MKFHSLEFEIAALRAVMDIFSNQTLSCTARCISATPSELKQELWQGFKIYFLYGCFPLDNSVEALSCYSSFNSKLLHNALNSETFHCKLYLLFYCVLPSLHLDKLLSSLYILIVCVTYSAFYVKNSGIFSLRFLTMLKIVNAWNLKQ